MMIFDRRSFLISAGAAAAFPAPLLASSVAGFQMWHSPGCNCCLKWKERIDAQFGRQLKVIETPDMLKVKRANGVPQGLWGCHTALIGKVVVEGHVPPADIRRFIDKRPKGFSGLAVPLMPLGAPGMDVGHSAKEPYKVYAFAPDGRRTVFASYE